MPQVDITTNIGSNKPHCLLPDGVLVRLDLHAHTPAPSAVAYDCPVTGWTTRLAPREPIRGLHIEPT